MYSKNFICETAPQKGKDELRQPTKKNKILQSYFLYFVGCQ